MLSKKVLQSKEAKDIYSDLGKRCKKDISLLNAIIASKGNNRYDLRNSSVERDGNTTTIKGKTELEGSDKTIAFRASKCDDADFYDISISINKEGTDLITGEGYCRRLAKVNYLMVGDTVLISKIEDEEDLEKQEKERLESVQRLVLNNKASK